MDGGQDTRFEDVLNVQAPQILWMDSIHLKGAKALIIQFANHVDMGS